MLAAVILPLLELFSVVDDVFTEPDALQPENRKVGLARIYRGWKVCRSQMDPDWERVSRRLPR